MAGSIHILRKINASSQRVYQALTQSEDLIHRYSAGGGWTTPFAGSDPVPLAAG